MIPPSRRERALIDIFPEDLLLLSSPPARPAVIPVLFNEVCPNRATIDCEASNSTLSSEFAATTLHALLNLLERFNTQGTGVLKFLNIWPSFLSSILGTFLFAADLSCDRDKHQQYPSLALLCHPITSHHLLDSLLSRAYSRICRGDYFGHRMHIANRMLRVPRLTRPMFSTGDGVSEGYAAREARVLLSRVFHGGGTSRRTVRRAQG
ncbi:hypothetical protein EI94DRAFT_1751974 [Lactarius quietus]|nr:hypothetical protein EI94DRAFT_1751974 [Lactarius quietus]